ncbi:hypothetical protein A2U01_0079279, partial [Trifolium medium]|nr:hypothetical protein [Trifolium medium]
NHLPYLNRLSSHDGIDDMAARNNDLRLVRAALEVTDQPFDPSLGHRHHVCNLQARAAAGGGVAPVSPW